MGQRASDTRGITFEDVVIPKEVSWVVINIIFFVFDLKQSFLPEVSPHPFSCIGYNKT